jgi:predicted dehydrogenase
MNYLVIGLGSMGKRRIRNLKALGVAPVAGLDPRADRRAEAAARYGIETFAGLEQAFHEFKPGVFVISTPPDLHMHYAYEGLERGISCFIEASVVDADRILELSRRIAGTSLIMAPSCTMRYYAGPRRIKELLRVGAIGKVLNINYHTGQYLPDWHPWESIESFYVSKRETGGAREIVPFELTWLDDIFGQPQVLACCKTKLTEMPADIDDIYHCLLKYEGNILANMTVEVVSRPKATRYMRILGSEGEIVFDGESNSVRYINTTMTEWDETRFNAGTVEAQYINPEEPYIAELGDFVAAVASGKPAAFPNTLQDDYRVLQTLSSLERMSGARQ